MLRQLLCMSVLLVSASGPVLAQDSPFARGCDLMQHKRFGEAITTFTEGLNSHPDDSNSYLRRGQSFFCLGNYKDAIADFDHTLDLMPSDYNAYIWRGTSHAKLQQDDLAIRDYEVAMRLNPQLLDNFKASAPTPTVPATTEEIIPNGKHTTESVNVATGKNTIDDYTNAANKLLSLPAAALFRQGTSYSGICDKQGNLIQVPGYYGADADGALIAMRGEKYYSLRNPKKDLTSLEQQINARPEDASLYFLRGRIFEQLGDNVKAQADLMRAADIDKKNPHYRLARAFFYHFQNNNQAAEDDIKAAQFLEPLIPLDLTFGPDIAHPSKK